MPIKEHADCADHRYCEPCPVCAGRDSTRAEIVSHAALRARVAELEAALRAAIGHMQWMFGGWTTAASDEGLPYAHKGIDAAKAILGAGQTGVPS